MRISNVRQHGREGLFDIEIENGHFQSVSVAGELPPATGQDDIDASGKLALSPFIDPHVHLDTALTAGEPVWNRSGTLFGSSGITVGKSEQDLRIETPVPDF